jgi:signal transduction histidine kinase
VDCEYAGKANVQVPDSTVAIHLYRIAQEAVNNALKHSHANKIRISMRRQGGDLQIKVTDDGRGISAAAKKGGGIGLQMMQYRAVLIGAKLEILSKPKIGTKITCLFHLTQ